MTSPRPRSTRPCSTTASICVRNARCIGSCTKHDLVGERRRGHARRSHAIAPPRHATGPNQVWTWDISRLRGPAVRVWFYLYVVFDIYSRKIVGWTIDTVESDKVAKRLITRICQPRGHRPRIS